MGTKNLWRLLTSAGLVVCLTSGIATAQTSPIVVSLDTVMGYPGQKQIEMPFYFDNYVDTIAGFSIWFQLDRPNVCSLKTTVDTTGSLISDWPILEVRNIGGEGYDLRVVGLSLNPPAVADPIFPQQSGKPLFTLLIDMYDTISPLDDGVNVLVDPSSHSAFQLSDPHGNQIGWSTELVPDTACWVCLEWLPGDPPVCLEWQRTLLPPCDSISIDSVLVARLDTVYQADPLVGWVEVADYVCGDFNLSGAVNLTDITLMVNFLFLNGAPPENPGIINLYEPCTSGINLTDMTKLVNAVFLNGEELECCP